METLELDVLIYPDEVRLVTPEDLVEWELETASQVSIPTVRLFVALYPYNPAAMSPNYETAAEELPFVPGQIIKVKKTMWCLLFLQSNVKVVQAKWCAVLSWCSSSVLACLAHMFEVVFPHFISWKASLKEHDGVSCLCCIQANWVCTKMSAFFSLFISCYHFQLIDVICRLFTDSVYCCNMQIHTCISFLFFFQNLKKSDKTNCLCIY